MLNPSLLSLIKELINMNTTKNYARKNPELRQKTYSRIIKVGKEL